MNLKEYSIDLLSCEKAIKHAVDYQYNFAVFRFPNTTQIYFVASKRLTDFENDGFVIAPFEEDSTYKKAVIPFDYSYSTMPQEELSTKNIDFCEQLSTSKTEYVNGLSLLIESIGKTDIKVVYSRVITLNRSTEVHEFYKRLVTEYTHAFVFCFYSSVSGLWIGATPELLLRTTDTDIYTMALAGTRIRGEKVEWDNKNIKEQTIVTEYISNVFKSNGLTIENKFTYTKTAGPIEHICTEISAKKILNLKIDRLLSELSPTPALCGYPKEYALNRIKEYEKHSRKYYGGYIGPKVGNSMSLYVNLRSMECGKDSITLYVGGGITSQSEIEKEWIETENKSKTLLNLL